jgi:hypothetical protein
MRYEFDLSAAPVLKAVPDGIYLLQVISSKEKVNDKGNNDIQFEFKILQPDPCMVDNEKVETLYMHYYISKDNPMQSLSFLQPLWKACGKLQAGVVGFDTQDIYGCTFGAEIVFQPGNTEFPNPKNAIRNYFEQSNCPPAQMREKTA